MLFNRQHPGRGMTLADACTVIEWGTRHFLYERGGILSNPVDLLYVVTFHQPWHQFICITDPRYDFLAHELRLGPHENNPESMFWRNRVIFFRGYANRYYPKHGLLRGYLEARHISHRTAVQVHGGQLVECISHKELTDGLLSRFAAMAIVARATMEKEKAERKYIRVGTE
jgi:hypothetical protein